MASTLCAGIGHRVGFLVSMPRTLAVTALSVLLICGAPAGAADRFWIKTTGGEWYDQANWVATFPPLPTTPSASVPGVGDSANFRIGGSDYTVTFADDVDVNIVKIPNDFATFDLLTRHLVTSQAIHVGTVVNDIGTLTLRNGEVSSPVMIVGFNIGDGRLFIESDAVLNIEGSQVGLDFPFSIGGAPTTNEGLGLMELFGTVNVRDADSVVGGRLRGVGTAIVDGGTWATDGSLIIGHDGADGHVFIINGGVVTAGELTYVGETGRTNEFVDVTGTGELSITNGTLTTTGTATIGSAENSFGEADVVGQNSEWNIGGFLLVGEFGIGNLHVRNEARVHVQNDTLISVGDNEALLNVTTFGSLINEGSLYVGGSTSSSGGPGHLLVQSDGELEVGGLLKVWETGTLTIDGGTIRTDSLMIQPGATLNFDSGQLIIDSGVLNIPLIFDFGGGSQIDPPEIILLNGALADLTDFSLGITPGTFSSFEINGSTMNASDGINIGGNDSQSLGGGLLSLTGGFANAGDVLRIWNDGEFVVNSGHITATEVRITGGAMTVNGGGSTMYVDASSDFPAGILGIHIGLAPAFTELTIEDGGELAAPGIDVSIAADTGSFAFATVTGPDSSITGQDARIGSLGDGTLNVFDQATATFTGDLTIGQGTNSLGNVSIDGAGSKVTCEGTTTVGRQGLGTLHLTNGGSFRSKGDTRIGALAAPINPAPGFVIVEDSDWVSDQSIYVGGDEVGAQVGGGQIFLKPGGTIINQGTMRVWPTGVLTVEGGDLRTRDLLLEDATLELLSGSIEIDGGQFRTPSSSLVFGGADENNPVAFSFINGADAQTQFAWHIGRNVDTFGSTTVSGVANGVPSTLRGTGGGGGADLVVGLHGNGRLDVLDGGLVDFGDDVIIGSRDAATGVVNVRGVADGVRSTIQATRSGGSAGIAVGGQHDGGDLTGGTGQLNVRDGGLVNLSGDLFIGLRPGSLGAVVIAGTESTFNAEFNVGDNLFLGGGTTDSTGDGSLHVQDGGFLTVGNTLRIGPTASVSLSGGTLETQSLTRVAPGSLGLKRGTIRIDGGTVDMGEDNYSFGGPERFRRPIFEFVNGALFEIPTSFNIGGAAGTFAKTIVDGVNGETPSTIRSVNDNADADIVVGEFGDGILEVRNGGLIDASDDFIVGAGTGSKGLAVIDGVNNGARSTVLAHGRGANSAVSVGARLAGETGNGELRITNGALVSSSGEIDLAHQVGSVASVQVGGSAEGFDATLRTDGDLFVGGTRDEFGGRAQILVGRGGLVEVNDVFKVWFDGFVDMDGGTVRANHLDLTDAEASSFNFSTGRVEAHRISGDFENFAGTLAHGAIVGSMSIDGNYFQSGSATLEVEIIDLNLRAVHDTVNVTGTVTLAGTLQVIMDHGFTPAVGERFTIMTYASREGEFDSISIDSLVFFGIVYNDTSAELVVLDSTNVPGDLNGNGIVDLADHVAFHACMTGPAETRAAGEVCLDADLTNDGPVDLRDFARLQLMFGSPLGSGATRWTSPTDGLWSDLLNWRGAELPGEGSHVFVDVPDAEVTVTHDHTVPSDEIIGDLLCNEKLRLEFDTLSVGGAFRMNNVLEMVCGNIVDSTVDLGLGGFINVVLSQCASTLDGVTVNGNVDILGTNNVLKVFNGLTLNGTVRIAGFTGSTGNGLMFQQSNRVLDGNGIVSFISNPSASFIAHDAGSLHVKPGITIRGAEGRVGRSDQPLVQDGVVDSDASGTIKVRGLNWVNNGTLRTRGTGSELWAHDSWTNNGSIEAANEARLILGDPGHSFQNLGTITATDADVRLNGDFTIADLGAFDFTNSLVVIEGTLINDAGFVLDANRFNWKLGKGTILGGTISSADGTNLGLVAGICCGFATLDGVTLDADMRMSRNNILVIENGLTLNGVITMPGFIAETVNLHFDGPNRFIDGTGRIEFSRAGQNNMFQTGTGGAGDLGVLTIGPGITIGGAGGVIGVRGNVFPASLVNEGTIHSDRSGGVVLHGTGSINNGIVTSTDGSVQITGPWTNNGTVHSGGGLLRADKTWTNNGIARLGAGPFLESKADYTQSSTGTFISEIRSTLDGGYGKMIVTGTASLDGVLRIEFESTFTPSAGQSFAVLQYGDHVGEFTSLEVIGLDAGLEIVPTYQETILLLRIEQQ